jgi:hypothetical protein
MNKGIEMNMRGLYIYGIIPNYYSAEQYRELDKLNVLIPLGKVSAVAAEKAMIDYRNLGAEPLAKLLLSHQQTIESIMELGFNTIIPVRLGTFADNTPQVKRILEQGYDLILETFEKISGFMEIDVVATWADFEQVIAGISVDPQVVELKSKIEKSENITQSDQMEIGYLVKKLIDQQRDELTKKIFSSLEPFCQSMKQHELQNDQMVSNTAFMVNQQQQALIEQALDELDEELKGKLNFKLVGPLPCYSFYTLEVNQVCYEDLVDAQKELETDESVSMKSIKQAYLKKAKHYHPDQNPDDEEGDRFNKIQQAYQTLLSYVQSQNPESGDETLAISTTKLAEGLYTIKIRNGHV